MYHEHVAVTVLSTTSDIQACLEQGIARDLMHCHIQTSGAHGAWHSSDIILCELSLSSLQPIRSRMREDAYLLYTVSSCNFNSKNPAAIIIAK